MQSKPTRVVRTPINTQVNRIKRGVKSSDKASMGTSGLIYGSEGIGKTHLLCSASEIYISPKPLIVTIDGYDETLSKFSSKIDYFELMPELRGNLSTELDKIATDIINSGYKFVAIDSGSKLYHALKFEIIGSEASKKDSKHDPDVAEQRDYQRLTSIIAQFVWKLHEGAQRNDFIFMMTGWERAEWIGDKWFYYPDFPPELRRLIGHDFSFVYRMVKGTKIVKVPNTTKTNRVSNPRMYVYSSDCRTKDKLNLGPYYDSPKFSVIQEGIEKVRSRSPPQFNGVKPN